MKRSARRRSARYRAIFRRNPRLHLLRTTIIAALGAGAAGCVADPVDGPSVDAATIADAAQPTDDAATPSDGGPLRPDEGPPAPDARPTRSESPASASAPPVFVFAAAPFLRLRWLGSFHAT